MACAVPEITILTPEPSSPVSIPDTQGSATEAYLTQTLATLPPDAIVRVLRLLHPDLLKQALQPQADAPVEEINKRKSIRHRTLKVGKLIYNGRTSIVDCQIRDMSETGCRIRIDSTAEVPRNFELHIKGSDQVLYCEVRWRSTSEIGLRFIERP